jgi:hypothetical protein
MALGFSLSIMSETETENAFGKVNHALDQIATTNALVLMEKGKSTPVIEIFAKILQSYPLFETLHKLELVIEDSGNCSDCCLYGTFRMVRGIYNPNDTIITHLDKINILAFDPPCDSLWIKEVHIHSPQKRVFDTTYKEKPISENTTYRAEKRKIIIEPMQTVTIETSFDVSLNRIGQFTHAVKRPIEKGFIFKFTAPKTMSANAAFFHIDGTKADICRTDTIPHGDDLYIEFTVKSAMLPGDGIQITWNRDVDKP